MIRNFYSRRARMRGPIQSGFQQPIDPGPMMNARPPVLRTERTGLEQPMMNTMPVTGQGQPIKVPPPATELPTNQTGVGFDPNKKKLLMGA